MRPDICGVAPGCRHWGSPATEFRRLVALFICVVITYFQINIPFHSPRTPRSSSGVEMTGEFLNWQCCSIFITGHVAGRENNHQMYSY